MKVSLKKAFSILDGRISTNMGDVYEMLNYIFDDELMTHQLPIAVRKIEDINPDWFQNSKNILNDLKQKNNTDDFNKLMKLIDKEYSEHEIEIGKIDYKIDFTAGLQELTLLAL